jgi:hypothetical protein
LFALDDPDTNSLSRGRCGLHQTLLVRYDVMRMVFTVAPDEVFYPARDRLVAAFDR